MMYRNIPEFLVALQEILYSKFIVADPHVFLLQTGFPEIERDYRQLCRTAMQLCQERSQQEDIEPHLKRGVHPEKSETNY